MKKNNKNSNEIKILKYLKIVLHEASEMFEEYCPVDYNYKEKAKKNNDYEKILRK